MLTEYHWAEDDVTATMTTTLNNDNDSDVFISIYTDLPSGGREAWIVLTVGQVHDLIRDLQELMES